jgi:uncharacterized protein YjiS (DUF1127 family)
LLVYQAYIVLKTNPTTPEDNMSTITLNASARAVSPFRKAFQVFADFVEGAREARAIAARYESLSRLSDNQLAQRGLTRGDVPQAAVTGRLPV